MELVLVGRSNVGKSSVIRQLTGKRVLVGKRPGVTRRLARYRCGKLDVVDMPGFGFMAGVSRGQQERTKTEIVRYLEQNREKILFALEVVDARAFLEIAERWERRGQIPVDVEMFSFLQELGLNPIVVVNKIDLIYPEERDTLLDDICERLSLQPPWRQWPDVVAPISAKTGEGVPVLMKLVGERLRASGHGHLLRYLRKSRG
ncbi:MAG: GTP-binding protein EngB [Candidatus Hodarchaeaceae archaeon]|nr:GTP-binding protein EngB [Candidatus Hodarchaeaceae archaeon]